MPEIRRSVTPTGAAPLLQQILGDYYDRLDVLAIGLVAMVAGGILVVLTRDSDHKIRMRVGKVVASIGFLILFWVICSGALA